MDAIACATALEKAGTRSGDPWILKYPVSLYWKKGELRSIFALHARSSFSRDGGDSSALG